MRYIHTYLLLGLLFANTGLWAQSFSPVCRNFGPEDYGEDAEFRCAANDAKGTIYFGTNYGIAFYKGEKTSTGKNWDFLTLPQADVIYSLYMDTAAARLYVGGQNGFGYFQLSAYNKGEYVSLKEKLPAGTPNSETWHVERSGGNVVFHTLANLVVFDGEKLSLVGVPGKGIFHNIFKTRDGSLLVNALDQGWFVYRDGKLEQVSGNSFPVDKCYSVLSYRGSHLFIFRNNGIFKASFDGKIFSSIEKISSPESGLDRMLAEKQIYCATLSADSARIILGTLNAGILALNNMPTLSLTDILYEDQNTTGIASCYGLFSDAQKSTWILGKRNLSRLPADHALLYNEFKGVTVKGLAYSGKRIYVAAANGLYSLNAEFDENRPGEVLSGIKKLSEGDFTKVLNMGDTVYACTGSELVLISGEKLKRIASPAPITSIARINNTLWISTQMGLYKRIDALLQDEAIFPGNNILQAVQYKENTFLLADGKGILFCDNTGKLIKEMPFTSQNTRLFTNEDGVLLSHSTGNYRVTSTDITLIDTLGDRLWLLKTISNGEKIKFDFDTDNWPSLWLNDKKVNGFMSPVEINDAESADGYYYLATKTGLFISKLNISGLNESAQSIKLVAGGISYYAENQIRVPYDDAGQVTIFCGLNSFYDSYPNTRYFYRILNSEDSAWKWQRNSEINLGRESWGEYTLEIKVIYGNQLETAVSSLTFKVLKPWWATWWAILLWILLFLLFLYLVVQASVYRLKRSKIKLERIVEERTAEVVHQKNEIEKQKEEITDSINYAKRIQTSLLKDENKLQASLPGTFMLYLPKDIVSGDFYWYHEISGHMVLAVADCTGHGVPGAFMSMLGVAKLNEIAAKNIFMPDKLLHDLNHLIVETLGQNMANSDSRDGMDVALVTIDKKNKKLYFAGANRPLFMVNKKTGAFSEIKPTKLPVGGGQYGENRDYELHEVTIDSDTVFYLCTDGYADQFGGPQGKKFMSKRLQALLVEIAGLPPSQQREKLKKMYQDWKGRLEQVDDVCIAGMNFID